MKVSKKEYLEQQLDRIRGIRESIQHLETFPEERLMATPASGGWSALECLAHLNLTYAHYLPRCEAAFQRSKQVNRPFYRPGMLVSKMIKSLLPQEDGSVSMPMKTFKRTTPVDRNRPEELNVYLTHVNTLESMIERSKDRDLRGPRVVSLVGPLVRFRLGDAFAFVLAHDVRHINQALRALQGT